MSILRSLATVGGLTMVSRIAGFARDVLMAGILGAGPVADAFFVALKLPNLFRRLFAEGAFAVSFVPLYSGDLARGGDKGANRFAEDALSVMVTVLVGLSVVAMAGMPWVISVLAPGFGGEGERFELAVDFARVTFPYLLLIGLAALLGSVLNARDRFAPFAAAPVLFNLVLIVALLWAGTSAAGPGMTLSFGVAIAGGLQLVWMAWWCRRHGVRLHVRLPRLTPRVRRLLVLMGPGAVGAGVMQITAFFDILIASLLPAGAISYLYYADRLYQLPLGVVGIALGTAILPLLSRQLASGDRAAALGSQNRGIEIGLLFALPAAAALIVMPALILGVLFERGAFGAAETAATAAALSAYAPGIPAFILVKVLSAAYFAREDTAGPVRIAVICMGVNILLSLALSQVLGHAGIALATALAAWLNVSLLWRGLRRRKALAFDARLRARLPRLVLAAGAMALALLAVLELIGPMGTGPAAAVLLAALVVGGAGVYGGVAMLVGGASLADLRGVVRRRQSA